LRGDPAISRMFDRNARGKCAEVPAEGPRPDVARMLRNLR
jgi:hypothetical protein